MVRQCKGLPPAVNMEAIRKVYERLRNGHTTFAGGSCALCAAVIPARAGICSRCEALMVAGGIQCSRCAASLPQGVAPGSLCGRCLRTPPDFDSVFAPFRYAPPLDRLVIDLKYNDALHLARALARLLANAASEAHRPRPDVFIPVPLHRRRLRERGYNQSLEIARFLGRSMGTPIAARAAMRVRDTRPQATLSEGRRAQNVRRAFRADWPLEGMRVAIVDDVMTTGHTVNALAKALRKQGVSFIDVWLVARA